MSLRVVFMGTPAFAVPSLDALLRGPHRVETVITQADRPVGRGLRLRPSPVKQRALEAGIEVLEPRGVKEADVAPKLRAGDPQIGVVVAYGQLLPKTLLELPPLGCVNVHASLLPKYRGAAPVQWAILNGERSTGVSVIRLVERMDAGDILAVKETPVGGQEDASSLSGRLSLLGADLLMEALEALEQGTARPTPQDEAQATFAPRLRREDGEIRWDYGAKRISRMVLGLVPWPTAHTLWRGKGLKIYRARTLPWDAPGDPGEVVRADHETFWVKTGEGVLEVLELQLESRPRMTASAFVKGHGGIKGERLGN